MNNRLDAIPDLNILAKKASFKAGALARIVGVSGEGLRRHVKLRFNLAPKDWLSNLRMHEARRLLSEGQLVKEIAAQLGFQNPTHFSRAFRRECGISPRLTATAGMGRTAGSLAKKV